MNPQEAAATVNGESVGGDLDIEPSEPTQAGKSNPLIERLKSTEPHKPIESVDVPQEMREYWQQYLMRGIEKAAGANSRWAGIDLLYGVVGASLSMFESTDADDFDAGGDVGGEGL